MALTDGIFSDSSDYSSYSISSEMAAAEKSMDAMSASAKDIRDAIKAALLDMKKINEEEKKIADATKKEADDKKQAAKISKLEQEYQKSEEKYLEKKSKFNINFVKAAKDRAKEDAERLEHYKKQLQIQQDIYNSLVEQGKEIEAQAQKKKVEEDEQRVKDQQRKSEASQKVSERSDLIVKAAKSSADSLISSVDSAMSIYTQYMGKVTARLQSLDVSSEKTFDKLQNKISSLANVPYINQKTIYENIDKLTSEGISYNIEERAFLASLADKMVNSFDVGNATLTRLIRLYQEDFTQAMLGNEAWLTQMFNMMYEDTSYLKNVDENVFAALTDVMSTMDRADATTFQFEVQKWLGSLYEVGMSSDALTQLASALNALGTGNAAAIESSSVGTLLNLAIARSDYSLADILTQGLTGDAVNDILKSVVELLIDIKDNTSNQATLNAYANVMGVSLADIRGAYNLKSDLPYLWSQTMDLENAEKEVQNQIMDIVNTRTSMQEKINNLVDNMSVTAATNIAKSSSSYIGWLLGKTLVSVGSTIPGMIGMGVSVAGYLDLIAQMASAFSATAFGEANDDYMDNSESSKGTKRKFLQFFDNIRASFNGLNADYSIGELQRYLTGQTSYAVTGQRGSAYGVIKPGYGGVTSNLSSSYGVSSTEGAYVAGVIAGANVEKAGLENLETLASQKGYGYDVFSTESENEGYNEYDIYEELFYHQDHPIKVHLAYFDDRAEEQLIDYINNKDNNKQLNAIRSKVEGEIRVDTEWSGSGNIQELISAIRSS